MGSSDKLVIPGECIFPSKENLRPGQGTYELHGRIYASLTGYVFMKDELKGDKLVQVVEVRRSEEQKDHVIPYIDGIVTARVLNIGQRYSSRNEDTPLTSEYSAILRKEDIRSTERDKAEIAKCYQPGDIILARVLSFGDNISSFLLTTAEDQLGVVSSISTNEERLVPCDWESVKGVKTGITESRKVAQLRLMEYGNGPFHPYPYLSGNVPPQPIYNGYNTSNSAFFFPQPPNPSPITESYGSSGSYRTDISSYQDNMSGRWIQPPDYRPTGYRQVLVNPDQDDLVIERSYTPSFQGSGPPIYPDESHDEMRPIVAFCMTAEQLNVAEKLQAILNQLNLLSGEMREPLKELSARPGKEEDSLREFPTKKAITPKNLIANEDPMRIVVNTSNKLIRKPKSVTVSGDSCGPDVQSNDVLVVDSSKQSVRSLTNWAPTINTKKRKVGHIPSVPGSFSSDSSATKWVKPIDLNKSTDSVPLSNEREEESVQWYDSRIVMPIPLKIEGDAVILHEEPNTFERTPREEEFPSVKNGKSGSETLLNATQNTYSTSNLNSCQLSSRGRNDDSRSQERNYLEGPYSSKGSYSLRIIKGHRIHGDSRVCYAHLEGKCTAGIFCRFDHSGTVKRSCSRLLRGVCRPDNKSCSAPHYNLLKHQYPVCSFYLRGDCSAWPKCLLLHVKHSPGTTFCSDFGKGSCFRGIECEYVHSYQRHVIKSVEDFGFSQPDDENREVERDIDNTETGILNWIED